MAWCECVWRGRWGSPTPAVHSFASHTTHNSPLKRSTTAHQTSPSTHPHNIGRCSIDTYETRCIIVAVATHIAHIAVFVCVCVFVWGV